MNEQLIQEIAYFLISRASGEGIAIGTTKLVKLFYLIDHEFFKWHRRTLTGASWIFYHFGPYSEDLIYIAQRSEGIEPEPVFEFTEGKFYRGYKITKSRGDLSVRWSVAVRAAVESIYERWGPLPLALLLDNVYFETQPMLHATRFRELDFSLIPDPKHQVETPRDFSKLIPMAKLEELRRRLLSRSGGYRRTQPTQIKLDTQSEAALLAMGGED